MKRRMPRDASLPLPPGRAPADKIERLRQHRHDVVVARAKRSTPEAAEDRPSGSPHRSGLPLDPRGFARWWASLEVSGLLSPLSEAELDIVREEAWRYFHHLDDPAAWKARRLELSERRRAADELHVWSRASEAPQRPEPGW